MLEPLTQSNPRIFSLTTRLSAHVRARYEAIVHNDEGMTTIEYALGTLAAAALAGVLYAVVHSGGVQSAIDGLFTRALNSVK
ncbi:MAG: DUF4244 domain-containing protein [Corynebacterium sp.]|nr:DUF4244 domain-containing protein [Corynebacterium sp.]